MSARQLKLKLPQRGGRRRGAGRKPAGRRAGVSHKARPRFDQATAVHVTLRVGDHVWNLRSQRSFTRIEACFAAARGRLGLRIIEFSVLGNHLHLLVEADSSEALARGMQGLGVRLAKALNRLMRARGRVFADHFHARLLRSPTELVRALAYVLGNAAHHFGGGAANDDPYSSASCDRERVLGERRTWLLRTWLWRVRDHDDGAPNVGIRSSIGLNL